MINESLKQVIRVAKKYYLLEMKQEEIAKEENISKSTVSRLINRARELGYVTFNFHFPTITVDSLEEELKNTFNLKHVFVAESSLNDERMILSNIADGFARYLNDLVQDDITIGVSWGMTMAYMSEHLIPLHKRNVKIVQLNGGVSRANISISSESILLKFANNYSGEGYLLPVPSFVNNSFIANTLKEDSNIKEVFELIDQSQIIIFSVGVINKEALGVKAGYFSEDDFEDLLNQKYVGDICSRFFKKDGSYEDGELYNSVIGISLEQIKKKKSSICISTGVQKAESILAAIKGGYINTLFTDELTAQKILSLNNTIVPN
ncbi:sugar-binding transcriptional regulator [Paenibacillus donghaensis]|uniref:sugar-binding transcriptional regulator n=1 Tax=Paenibacillus donghaensis TaxID=414771 RepID=UPI0018838509|nr:sugar-binding transcriptional regulator [Paenibacillus donghaensis]MBE9912425.1 sugar-binding transcriptional regulator [Paenibacillus donghaensis]